MSLCRGFSSPAELWEQLEWEREGRNSPGTGLESPGTGLGCAEPLGSSQGFIALGSRKAEIVRFRRGAGRASHCPGAPGRKLGWFQVVWMLSPPPADTGKSPLHDAPSPCPLSCPWEGQHSRCPYSWNSCFLQNLRLALGTADPLPSFSWLLGQLLFY